MRPAQTSLEKHKEQQRDHTERVEQDTRLQHRIVFTAIRMRNTFSIAIVLLVVLTFTVEASMKKKEKGKEPKAEVECSEWQYGKCVPNSGDCGTGIREGTCNEQTKKTKCKVPCNWKKDFGADCKYKFGRWAECDMTTGTRSRSGTLKKALFNAECQTAIKVSKPCTQKTPKPKGGEKKKGKGKEN